LRYLDPHNSIAFADRSKIDYWMPVSLYVGGAEHAVLHLLYSRFWHKVLFDLGLVTTNEPFMRLINQGMILGEDNQKMSKSRGNVINPDDIVENYGADAMRMYEMFMGPLEVSKPWSTAGLVGVSRFLERIWALSERPIAAEPLDGALEKMLHKTIKKVTNDTSSLNFNTAISQMMIYSNELAKLERIPRAAWEPFVLLIAPYAPHLGEELWSMLGHSESISTAEWPRYQEVLTHDDEREIVVQVNGKVRGKFNAPADTPNESLIAMARSVEKISDWLAGKEIVKTITVQNKLVNFVIKG
jgi:leucyl-tRNA synthetase